MIENGVKGVKYSILKCLLRNERLGIRTPLGAPNFNYHKIICDIFYLSIKNLTKQFMAKYLKMFMFTLL